MASNLILPAAKSMAGQWTLTDKSNECTMIFSTQRLEWINSYKLSVLSDYSHDVLPQVPVAWRPAPDGIALLDSAGLAILFFSREGEHYRTQIWEPTGKILEKRKI
ncbi:protease [Salmonella enterica subsp. enterica serovar Enteritidis]|nr:protease [Salmonella enterica subsp. enterica serovar Enteritidis]